MAEATASPDATSTDECRVTWCTRPLNKRRRSGLCDSCWMWSYRRGGADPETTERHRTEVPPADGLCTIVEDGVRCTQAHCAGGKCKAHWQREARHGDMRRRRRANGELVALVVAAASATGDECFLAPCDSSRPGVTYRGEPMGATRAVWWEATGEDPGDGQVLHTCHRGDEGCISIRHLYLGDHALNMADMTEAERQARGEDNGNAELTESDVREIRRLSAAGGISQRALARQFGVSQGTINQIVTRKTWKHVE